MNQTTIDRLQQLTDGDLARLKAGFGGAQTVTAETDDGQTFPVEYPQECSNRFCTECVAILETEQRRRKNLIAPVEWLQFDLRGFSDEELLAYGPLYTWQRDVASVPELRPMFDFLCHLGRIVEREAERRGLSARVEELRLRSKVGRHSKAYWADS